MSKKKEKIDEQTEEGPIIDEIIIPPPQNTSQLEDIGFHLKPISRRSCGQCQVANICDILMQTDDIVVIPDKATCIIVRARGPKHTYK